MNRRSLLASGGGLVVAGVGASYLAVKYGLEEEYNAAVAAARAALRQTPEIRDFIRYATLAPSGHNTKPWKFRPGEGGVDILPDFSRRTPVVDPDDHHLFVGLGCSAETLAIAAGARGRPCEVAFDPANGGSVGVTFGNGDTSDIDLCDAIPKRQSTRSVYDGRAASATELQLLAKAAAIPGVDLVLITDRAQIDRPPARLLVRDSGLRVSGGRQGALGVGRPGLPAFCFASDRAGHQTRLRQPADRGSEPSAGVRQPPWPTGTAAGPRHAPVGSSVIA
jgi:hypothetical protein